MRKWTLWRWMIVGAVGTIVQGLPVSAAPAAATASLPAVAAKPAAATALPLPVQSSATSSAPVTATVSPAAATTTPSAPVVANLDMVCPLSADEKADRRYSKTLDGKIYYFCSARCLTRFSENPRPFLAQMPDGAALYASGDKPSGEGSLTVAEAIASVAADGRPQEPFSDNERILRFIGYFHPLLVHFPIALVFAAMLAEFLLAFTGHRFFAPVSLFSIRLAALLAILTTLSGWAGVSVSGQAACDEAAWILNWHRSLGFATTALTVLVAMISLGITHQSRRLYYRWMLYFAAAAVTLTGHFGGLLVYGQDYFRW